jgi:hypothetical protein
MVRLGAKTNFRALKTTITNPPHTKASADVHAWRAAELTMTRKDDDWDEDWDDKNGISTEFKGTLV